MTFDFGERARRASPNVTLPSGGNDATMQGIVKRGAPAASTGGMMMPLAPQARLDPGMTGQMPGPRVQVPMQAPMPVSMPVQPMRSPMAAVSSDRNHSYDGGLGFGSGLAGRAPVPKGRSNYNLDKIAERRFRQTRNPDMLQSQQWYHLQADRFNAPDAQPGMMTPMPAPVPSGHFEPGRSTGSQVWVRDAPAGMGGGGDGLMPMDRSLLPQPPEAPMPQPQAQQPMQPQQPFGFPFPSLPWDGKGPLPPSTLGGGNGVPPPPPVQRFDVAGPDGKPLAWQGYGPDGKPVPAMHGTYAQPDAAKPKEVPKIYDEAGVETLDAKTGVKSTSPQRHYYFEPHPQTGAPVKRYVQDESSDGTGSTGYNPFVKAKPAAAPAATQQAPAPAPAAPPVTTQTGQMPNVPFANDLSPEQQLAAAREHYAQTSDDSKLREYFKSNPSQAMQQVQKAQDAYQQVGAVQDAEGSIQKMVQDAAEGRDRWLKGMGANTFTVGAEAAGWEARHPEEAALLRNPQEWAQMKRAQFEASKSKGKFEDLEPEAAALLSGKGLAEQKSALMAQAEKSMQDYGKQRESDRLATKEQDFKRGWDLYKKAGNMSMLSDYTKGGKA